MIKNNSFDAILLLSKIKNKLDSQFNFYKLTKDGKEILSKNTDLLSKEKTKNIQEGSYSLTYPKNNDISSEECYSILKTIATVQESTTNDAVISTLKYRIYGVSQLLESVFEYMPIDILIKLFYEGLKEIFLFQKGVVLKLNSNEKYEFYYGTESISIDCKECIDSVKFSLPINLKYSRTSFLNKDIREELLKADLGILIPISVDSRNIFIILFSSSNIAQEDMKLINLSGNLFNKSLKLQKLVQDNKNIAETVSERSFEMLALLQTTKLVLSAKDYDDLSHKIGDMLMEIFQSEWSSTFFKKGDVLEFKFYRSISDSDKNYSAINIVQKNPADKYVYLNDEIEKLNDIFDLPKCFTTKKIKGALLYGDLNKITGLTLFGESVSEFDFNSESNEVLIEVIKNTIETAIDNVTFINKIKYERDRNKRYLNIINSILDFETILNRATSIKEINNLSTFYLKERFGFQRILIKFGNNSYEKEGIYKIRGKERLIVPIVYNDNLLGYISCGKRKNFPLNFVENFLILNIIAKTIANNFIFQKLYPSDGIMDTDSIIENIIKWEIEKVNKMFGLEPYLYLLNDLPSDPIGKCIKIKNKYLYISPEELENEEAITMNNFWDFYLENRIK